MHCISRARFRRAIFLGLCCLVAWSGCVLGQHGNLYDDKVRLYGALIEKMIMHAQTAAKQRNQGQTAESDKSVTLAVESFERARAALPDRHEAYLNIATFFFNSQQFDRSIEMWEKARELVERNKHRAIPEREKEKVLEQIDSQLKLTKFGKLSVERDKVYQNGRGDLQASYSLIKEQIGVFPTPRMFYDLATVQFMLSEVDTSHWPHGIQSYERSQEIALHGVVTFQRFLNGAKRKKRGQHKCPKGYHVYAVEDLLSTPVDRESDKSLVILKHFNEEVYKNSYPGAISRRPAYSSRFLTEGEVPAGGQGGRRNVGFVARVKNAKLNGPDGVITRKSKCRLDIFQTSSHPYVSLHANLWLSETWRSNSTLQIYDHSLSHKFPPPSPHHHDRTVVQKAATIVDFASHSFYHFLLQSVPKLIALKEFFLSDPSMKLIVPKDSSGPQFVERLLRIVLGKQLMDKIGIVQYDNNNKDSAPGERLFVRELLWADTARVVRSDSGAFTLTHCLTNFAFLQNARHVLLSQVLVEDYLQSASYRDGLDLDKLHGRGNEILAIYASRRRTSSRKLDTESESELLPQISARLADGHLFEFDGSKTMMERSMALFTRASLVFGIHGASLANILFCAPGTLVIEIGFHTLVSQHYEHAALALGLEYKKVLVENRESYAMTVPTIRLSAGQIEEIAEAVGTKVNELSRNSEL